MNKLLGLFFCLLVNLSSGGAQRAGVEASWDINSSGIGFVSSAVASSSKSHSTYSKKGRKTSTVSSSRRSTVSKSYASHYSTSKSGKSTSGVARDSHGKIKRSSSEKHSFMKSSGYPHGRPGYVVDHIVPLKKGGCDCPSNMQWQTVQAAKAKDKWE